MTEPKITSAKDLAPIINRIAKQDFDELVANGTITEEMLAEQIWAGYGRLYTQDDFEGEQYETLFAPMRHTHEDLIPKTDMGVANGVATLGDSGTVPPSQLPSYVDDVIEYGLKSQLPNEGEQGKIYVIYEDTKENNGQYRWTGSTYVSISSAIDFATGAEAVAGVDNTKAMTPLRTFQAIDSWTQKEGLKGVVAQLNGHSFWSGTKEQYDVDYAAGHIDDETTCFIEGMGDFYATEIQMSDSDSTTVAEKISTIKQNVQADWNATNGDAVILNKPTSLPAEGGNSYTVNNKTATATPLTTEQNDLVGMVNEVFTSASNGKATIATAITGKGVATSANDTYTQMATNIGNIQTGASIPTTLKEEWSYTGHTDAITSVAIDNQGNVYTASYDNTVRKLSPTGSLIWSYTGHTYRVYSVVVDTLGNVYSASGDKTARKISSTGTLIWSFGGYTDYVGGVAVDNQGNVYTASWDKTVRKLSPTGTEIWSYTGHTYRVYSVAVDIQGNVYGGGGDRTLKKISPTGSLIWSFGGYTDYVYGVDVDNQGNVYTASWDKTVKKISSTGSLIWSFGGHTNYVYDVAVDNQSNVYSCGIDRTLRKISPTGTEIWSYPYCRSVAVDNQSNVYSCGIDDNTIKKLNDIPLGVMILADNPTEVLNVYKTDTIVENGYTYKIAYYN